MEYSPPPLFKQGPSALARLVLFVVLALSLLLVDARFKALETVRRLIATGLYPLQQMALLPRDLALDIADAFVTNATLRTENRVLAARNLQYALQASRAAELTSENEHLRALLELPQHATTATIPAEIQYDTRDPFTQKVIISRGSQQGVQRGAPVINESGLIGQVTRVYPLEAEVTLLTDKDQAVPVQFVRTGIRSVIYGRPRGNLLDVRFVPISANVKVGDQLVTNGLDGVYPPGLPVARVIRVDRQSDTTFAHVTCVSIAPIQSTRQLLVLHYVNDIPPRPDNAAPSGNFPKVGKDATAKKGKMASRQARNAAPHVPAHETQAVASTPRSGAPSVAAARPSHAPSHPLPTQRDRTCSPRAAPEAR